MLMRTNKSQVGSYELKTHSSEILKLVESGETITVTRHGKPIAQISPITNTALTKKAAVEVLIDLASAAAKRGAKITQAEIKTWINTSRP